MLTAHNVTLAYQHNAVIVNISIAIEQGKISCLIGPNGSGKSTLLRALAGLMTPQSGYVQLDNKSLCKWPRKALARRLALLPQNPIAPDGISVQQLVSHGRYPYQSLLRQNSQADIDAVEWALEMTSMSQLRHRLFNTLSGGERQRGWIALALAQQSDILLLDEPTTYLDIGHQIETLNLLATLNRERQMTLVVVLHDINQACQYADRIIAMRDGQIVVDNSPLNAITEQLIDSVFGVKTELVIRQDGSHIYPYSMPVRSKKQR